MECFQCIYSILAVIQFAKYQKSWKYQDITVPIKLFNNERRNTMSKFWAKVNFKQEKNAEHLIRAFFQEFNPESSIVVRGKEAKLEIVFREPPIAIIEAINHCEVIELNYGKNLKEYAEDENANGKEENDTVQEVAESENFEQTEQEVAEDENSEQTEQEVTKSENSEQTEQEVTESENSEQTEPEVAKSENSKLTEQPKKKRGRPSTKKVETTKEVKNEQTVINIPELKEIAEKATSFEHFAELVAEWLEMDKRKELFTNLIIVSAEVDKITWKELEKSLKCKNVFYTQWDKIWSGQQVSEKLKKYSATLLTFLNATRQYKEYSFKKADEHFIKENSNTQATKKTIPNAEEKTEESSDSGISKPRVKMECMPEIKDFEETLASVDKTQTVEERVRYVLSAMGLNKLNAKEQKQITEIASTAVRKGRIAFDIIFVEANIPIEQTMEARMTFSKFVNDFVQKYESGKKVKLLTFLSELQKIIMFESEIENFSDFTD